MVDSIQPTHPRSKTADRALILGFLALICLPMVDLVFQVDPVAIPAKERVEFPAWPTDMSSAKAWPGSLRWYLKNNSGFRGSLVQAFGRLSVDVLQTPSSKQVLLGREGWLFLRGEQCLEDYLRTDPMTALEVQTWHEILAERAQWLHERNCQYLVVIAPNKHTIYPEQLPLAVRESRQTGPSRLDQLVRNCPVPILDLRKALRDAKKTGRAFHVTDTHWNEHGAWHAYRSIVNRIVDHIPIDAPQPFESFLPRTVTTHGGDLARLLGLQSAYQETWQRLASPGVEGLGAPAAPYQSIDVVEHGAGPLRTRSSRGRISRVVILRDSFGEQLIPMLAPHFREATWSWTYDFDRSLIEKERPVLVIQQLVERKLATIKPR